MAVTITRCPKCKTSFRIGEAHLKSAKGSVRCGSCLYIFNAREHLVDPTTLVKPRPETPPPPTTEDEFPPQIPASPPTAPGAEQKTQLDLATTLKTSSAEIHRASKQLERRQAVDKPATTSEPVQPKPAPAGQRAKPKFVSKKATPAPTPAPANPEPSPPLPEVEVDDSPDDDNAFDDDFELETPSFSDHHTATEDVDYDLDDFSIDEDDLEGIEGFDDELTDNATFAEQKTQKPPAPPKKTQPPSIDDDDELISDSMDSNGSENRVDEDNMMATTLAESDFSLFERNAKKADEEDEGNSSDESWALNMLEDLDQEDQQAFKDHVREDVDEPDEFSTGAFQIIDESDDPREPGISEESFDYDELDKELEEYQDIHDHENTGKQFIHSIEPEPVEFSWQQHRSIGTGLLWVSLSLLAVAGIVVQGAIYNFDRLSREQPYRKYYAMACETLGCELPVLRDRAKIRTTNLVVRSHPDTENALVVDAVIQNTAKFAQTFPTLDLVFTDMRGNPVAARRFTPDEYLSGELAGKQTMPTSKPIHIALELRDPGENAVNYRLTIGD